MAKKATEHCSKRTIWHASKQNPPSIYHVIEAVLVKVKDGAHRVSKGCPVLPGRIMKHDIKLSKYKVEYYQIPGDPKVQENVLFCVYNVASTTRQQEKMCPVFKMSATFDAIHT